MGDLDAMAGDARKAGTQVVNFLVGIAAVGTGLAIGTSNTIEETIDGFLVAIGLGGNALLNSAVSIIAGMMMAFFLGGLARAMSSMILKMIFMFLAIALGTAVVVQIVRTVLSLTSIGEEEA